MYEAVRVLDKKSRIIYDIVKIEHLTLHTFYAQGCTKINRFLAQIYRIYMCKVKNLSQNGDLPAPGG
jgi:hypothetical protein